MTLMHTSWWSDSIRKKTLSLASWHLFTLKCSDNSTGQGSNEAGNNEVEAKSDAKHLLQHGRKHIRRMSPCFYPEGPIHRKRMYALTARVRPAMSESFDPHHGWGQMYILEPMFMLTGTNSSEIWFYKWTEPWWKCVFDKVCIVKKIVGKGVRIGLHAAPA